MVKRHRRIRKVKHTIAPKRRLPSYIGYMNSKTRAGMASSGFGVIPKASSSGIGLSGGRLGSLGLGGGRGNFGMVGGYGGQAGRIGTVQGSGQLGALRSNAGAGGAIVGGYTPGGIWPQKHAGPPTVYQMPHQGGIQQGGGSVFARSNAPMQGQTPPPSPQEQEAKRLKRDARIKMVQGRAMGIAGSIGSAAWGASKVVAQKTRAGAVAVGKEAISEYGRFQASRKKLKQYEEEKGGEASPFESEIAQVKSEGDNQRYEEEYMRRGD